MNKPISERVSPNQCCGCLLCVSACPSGAISVGRDDYGFQIPKVDSAKCTGCGRCAYVCPACQHSVRQFDVRGQVWAARAKDDEIRRVSSSGGIFPLLAQKVITDGGLVAGVRWNPKARQAEHVIVDRIEDVGELVGSKYVQSDTRKIYKSVQKALDGGRRVLFSGTPCQVTALRLSLGEKAKAEGLLLVEVICHGVPSPAVLSRYLATLFGSEQCVSVRFRDKSLGWKNYSFVAEGLRENMRENPYLRSYLTNLNVRPSCFSCPMSYKLAGDITLGDCWFADKLAPALADDLGLSAVLTTTAKGRQAFAGIADRVTSVTIDASSFFSHNLCVVSPIIGKRNSARFFNAWRRSQESLEELVARYGKRSWFIRLLNRFRRHLAKSSARKLGRMYAALDV